jgi:hypothetical protein
MTTRFLFLVVAFFSVLSAETVTKNSPPFAFPSVVGVIGTRSLQSGGAVFHLRPIGIAGTKMEISWSLPVRALQGSISIFNVSGSRVKTFTIVSPSGRVQWDISNGNKAARGIYFAALSYGACKKNCTVVLY